jgi:hypothetical protein
MSIRGPNRGLRQRLADAEGAMAGRAVNSAAAKGRWPGRVAATDRRALS